MNLQLLYRYNLSVSKNENVIKKTTKQNYQKDFLQQGVEPRPLIIAPCTTTSAKQWRYLN